ncbi:MAG: HD-GYP domain-containing protein [Planctomycetota bacterium]|jgi:HD-GYP domain-containing protein (c-di-GMP phosphodiesterase class II)
MPEQNLTIATTPEAPPANDLQGPLAELRAHVAMLHPDTELDRLVWNASEAADRIVCEHLGMAEELLSVYEQLGVVFEVTRKLSTVQHESEMVALFVESLRRSFDRRMVIVAKPQAHGGWVTQECDIAIGAWIEAAMQRAHDEAAVVVEQSPEGNTQSLVAEVMVGPVFAGAAFVCAILLTRARSVQAFRACDMMLMESLGAFCGDLISVHRLGHELREMSITTVLSLVNAVDQKDEYTSGHSLRVGYYATLLGRRLNMGETDLQMLQWSALLHDVGKIGIRDEVLKKKGKLTEEEFDHIREHPVRSHRVVKQVPQLAKALDGVRYHHEHFDGSGYPEGLAGENIPLEARIIQIADVFDALTSSRSYRSAYDWPKALAILRDEAGKTVDHHLQTTFDSLIREKLEGDPHAWETLIRTAEQFRSVGSSVQTVECRAEPDLCRGRMP